MGKKVVHFEVIGKDGKKLQDFYAKLFDWKIDANNPMNYGMVTPEDSGLGGGIGGQDMGPGHVTVYVEVDDLAAALGRAGDLDEGEVAVDHGQVADVADGDDVDEFEELFFDLIDLVFGAVDDDGHAAEAGLVGVAHGEAFDVEAAAAEEGGDAGEDARAVFDVRDDGAAWGHACCSITLRGRWLRARGRGNAAGWN